MYMGRIEEALSSFIDSVLEVNKKEIEEKLDIEIAYHVEELESYIVAALEGCKSPIEKLFAIHFHKAIGDSALKLSFDVVDVENQVKVLCDDREYIIDFLVKVLKQQNNINHFFAIECDGHDFHEKTKEQAKNDRKRERALIKHGFVVIRFTGSEIYENPFYCAKEAISTIESFVGSK